MPIVNARMYSVTAECKADWHRVLAWALQRADLDWEIVDHDAPAPLAQLWARDDLGAAMMCGLPFSKREPRPTLIAAPLPSPPRYGGQPVYCTDIVVAADSPHRIDRGHLRRRRRLHARRFDVGRGGVARPPPAVARRERSAALSRRRRRPGQRARRDRRARRGPHRRRPARQLQPRPARALRPGARRAGAHDREHARCGRSRRSSPPRRSAPTRSRGCATRCSPRDDASELAAPMARLQLAGFAVPDPSDYDVLAAIADASAHSFEDL